MSDNYPTPAETAAAWGRQNIQSGPAWTPQPPKPRKRVPLWAWFLIALGAMFLLCSIGAIALAGGSDPADKALVTSASPGGQGQAVGSAAGTAGKKAADLAATPKPTTKPVVKPATPAYKLGVPFRAGDFQYTVHSKKCGLTSAGNTYLKVKPQGSYCRLDVSAKNVTKSAHYFTSDSTITVTDTQGRTFSADATAGIYANEGSAGWLDEINPGNSVRAYVFFDVAGGVKLVSATFSAGVFTTAQDVTLPF